MKIKVTKPIHQADPDPSQPHHHYEPGVYDVPDWLAARAIERGEARSARAAPKDPKKEKDPPVDPPKDPPE